MTWSDVHARIHRQLKQHSLIPRSSQILIAVSGGQDSLCLAQICLDLADRWDWRLTIGHCDHRWRDDSAANARFVAHLAETWGVPYHQRTAEIALTSEADARSWRYRQLVAIAQDIGATHIATGHTASDRAETLLHHLLRGTGTDGLSAIARSRPLTEFQPPESATSLKSAPRLVRPLFEILRHETASFCADRGLPIWEDSTNHDETYTRNRIRHRLLPILHEQFNPKIEAALARTSDAISVDRDCLEAIAAAGLIQASDRSNRDRLHRPTLQTFHLAIQRRIVRHWLEQALGHAPNFAQIAKVIVLIDSPQKTRTDPIVRARLVEVCGHWLELKRLPEA
ncbi:MAG: tRNA lysidine(34) synthetase TilS [Coleofasciculaceae cyanobacterium RL_1_1]|nr:tRNA lysidine(34) synthetase TilS [Coleofasciculaceae cyanobacterium RL_1_1]